MRALIFSITSALICYMSCLPAEIEKIAISWTPMLCQGSCSKLLETQFKKIPGIAEFEIDQPAGQAMIKWEGNAPYSYNSINVAMRMVGLSIKNIRVRASGFIQHTKQNVYLISRGDNTRFELINPIIPNAKGQTVQYNLATRALSPELRQQLLNTEAEKEIVTIEGILFMPERHEVPEKLVAEQISFPQKEKNSKGH